MNIMMLVALFVGFLGMNTVQAQEVKGVNDPLNWEVAGKAIDGSYILTTSWVRGKSFVSITALASNRQGTFLIVRITDPKWSVEKGHSKQWQVERFGIGESLIQTMREENNTFKAIGYIKAASNNVDYDLPYALCLDPKTNSLIVDNRIETTELPSMFQVMNQVFVEQGLLDQTHKPFLPFTNMQIRDKLAAENYVCPGGVMK